MTAAWIDRFPGLAQIEPAIREELSERSAVIRMKAGTVIFGPHKRPENLLLLTEGIVRVQQTSEGGRDIVLYRVMAGESCVMTTACLLAYEDYAAEGIAETDIEAVAIPREVFDGLMSRSAAFRAFVFNAYSRRITELFHVIEEIAFQRMDIRIAQKLIELARGGEVIHATHQQLGAELGTAREVVSRQLAEFQRRGWIAQSRGEVRLVNPQALEALAGTA